MANIITELIEAIQAVYPHRNTLPLSKKDIPPTPDTIYPALSALVVNKLNSLYFRDREKAEDDPGNDDALYAAHHQLLKALKENLPELEVREGPNNQFPDLGFELHFGERQFDYINSICYLQIRISLIANYYTFFFGEFVRMFYQGEADFLNPVSLATFVSGRNEFVDPDQHTVKTVKTTVEKFFPKHHFVSHRILLNRRYSDAIPFREFDSKDYPLYNFFFGFTPPKPVIIRQELELTDNDTGIENVILTPPAKSDN